jgi:hypothetical protein
MTPEPDIFPPPSLWRDPPVRKVVARPMPHREDCACPLCRDYPPVVERRKVEEVS